MLGVWRKRERKKVSEVDREQLGTPYLLPHIKVRGYSQGNRHKTKHWASFEVTIKLKVTDLQMSSLIQLQTCLQLEFKANISKDKTHSVHCQLSHILCRLLPVSNTTLYHPVLEVANILPCPQTELRSSSVSLPPPLCTVLTFKGLVWPRAPRCHALGPEMPSLSLSFCLSLSNLVFLWPGWVSTIKSIELCRGSRKWSVLSLSMAMLTLAKRGQQKLGRFSRYHFTNLTYHSQH